MDKTDLLIESLADFKTDFREFKADIKEDFTSFKKDIREDLATFKQTATKKIDQNAINIGFLKGKTVGISMATSSLLTFILGLAYYIITKP